MTRKKFIKSCMGAGIDKKVAAQLAVTARTKYGSYFKGLGLFLNTYTLIMAGQDPSCLYPAAGGGTK